MAFLSGEQLASMGFKKIGKKVQISDKASIYGCEHIEIGDYTRIDDFCVIAASKEGITVGRNVHIACFGSMTGRSRITMDDFSGLSSRGALYSSSDDFSGHFLTGPTLPGHFANSIDGPVYVGRHAVVGAGTIVLPNVTIGEGSVIGALSLVKTDCEPFKIYAGVPARLIKDRSGHLLQLADEYMNKFASSL